MSKRYNNKEYIQIESTVDLLNKGVKKVREQSNKKIYNVWQPKIPSYLKRFAQDLNEDLPNSEIWFQKEYKTFKDKYDRFNRSFWGYIPDVINYKYKYIIEIDGSIHDTPEQQIKDWKKNKKFRSKGFKVFRLKPYLTEDFNLLMQKLKDFKYGRKKSKNSNKIKAESIKPKIKTILRKKQT